MGESKRSWELKMSSIIFILLLQTGVFPVISQYNQNQVFPRSRYSNDYADDEYSSSSQDQSNESDQQRDSSVGLQQSSFFDSASGLSLVGGSGSYGGLTPPPPPEVGTNSGKLSYSKSERRIIVPSSLRELEESYIRSLSSPTRRQHGFDPFGGNGAQGSSQHGQQSKNIQGVENYAGFIMTNRRLDRNQLREQQIQSAPITYGFPLLTQQISASNSIDALFGRKRMKQRGKVYDYRDKNVLPNFPDFSDRPPVPQEPDIPSEEETGDIVEEATRKPPIHILPTPANIQNFFANPPSPPLTSSTPIFDRSFPEPILQRGFIPSFGPPTKEPFIMHHHPLPDKIFQNGVNVHEFNHNYLPSHAPPHAEITTTSPVPVLRPEYPIKDKDQNTLPDEVSSSIAPNEDLGPKSGTVYKHISVHVPPEDLDEELSSHKVIKVGKKPEKHIKVILIKPPDTPTQKTEVEIPPTPQQKTLVYVLSESGGVRNPIRLVKPAQLKPAPPQVFFLRYNDPSIGGSQSPPSSTSNPSLEGEREPTSDDHTERPRTPPPIKQLASPANDPEAELLRSAPSPVLPTYSSFNNPSVSSTPVSRLAFHTINSPNLYTPSTTANTNYNTNNINNNNDFENNDIGDPTNGRYQGSSPTSTAALPEIANNNQLTPLPFNSNSNGFPPQSTVSPSQQPQPNYYSTLYHLYPPPVNSPHLFPLYYNQITHPSHPKYYPYLRDQSKSGSSPASTSSSIQGLYTVAPYLQDLPGSVNFNSLVQNPDGKNLPRSPRNYVMMTYAPNYMPSASASENTPVFTSPEAFLKSLLGDSYMYYNNTGNNSGYIITNLTSSGLTATTTTTTTTTTPVPPPAIKAQNPNNAQHHTFPVIFNLESFQNLSRPDSNQPLTILIGNPYGLSPQTNTANIQIRNPTLTAAAAAPYLSSYSKLVPPFLLSTSTTTTTSTTPQPRISWVPSTTPPPTPPQSPETTTTQKDIYHLPVIIYNSNKPNASPPPSERITTEENVASHFNNLFKNFQQNPAQIPKTNQPASKETIESSTESGEGSSEISGSEESSGSGSSEAGDSGSGEEIIPIYFEPTKNPQQSRNSSSIIYVKNNKKKKSSDRSRTSKRPGRKRVNPAHVKPGRRLRKVKKPSRSNRNHNKKNNNNTNNNNEKEIQTQR